MSGAARQTSTALAYFALVLFCVSLFTCTSPGRITYPDDEIVFQTTQSLADRGELAIEGIAKRTGERVDRPTGTFGWAPGRDGKRYGFFGHGTSLVATPAYLLGRATAAQVPELWRYAVRSDLFTFHRRNLDSDWRRLVTNLTNCWVTALAAALLGLWLQALGHGPRASLLTALVYALGSSAWPYSKTLLSEPLSTVLLLGAALGITRWRQAGGRGQLWVAASLAGLSVHAHVLNVLAIPCLLGYALATPELRARALRADGDRGTWLVALALGGAGLALLGYSQWWRFGSPFETGRFDHYGHWVWPFEALGTMLVAPGRSLLWYSPPLLLSLWLLPRLWQRQRACAALILALTLTRALFVACRSDWHGGWAIGPRYLLPLLPFLLVPLAGWIEQLHTRSLRVRVAALAASFASVAFQAWLAAHSVFQLFWRLNIEHGRERYMWVSDWQPSAAPPIAFWLEQQEALSFWRAGDVEAARNLAKFDMLAFGAWRLGAATGEYGLWRLCLGVGVVGAGALALLVLMLRRLR